MSYALSIAFWKKDVEKIRIFCVFRKNRAQYIENVVRPMTKNEISKNVVSNLRWEMEWSPALKCECVGIFCAGVRDQTFVHSKSLLRQERGSMRWRNPAALPSLLCSGYFLTVIVFCLLAPCNFCGFRNIFDEAWRRRWKKGGTVVGGVGSTECRRDSTFFSREMISRSLFATVSLWLSVNATEICGVCRVSPELALLWQGRRWDGWLWKNGSFGKRRENAF